MTNRGVDIADICSRVTLPNGLQWLEVGGQMVFPVYGTSGGSRAEFIAILLDPLRFPPKGCDLGSQRGLVNDERGHYFICQFGVIQDHHQVTAQFKEAFDAMRQG